MSTEAINISDVIEVIESDSHYTMPRKPWVRIVEQPASKALRFRYECEGRSAGSIPGASSTPDKRTFPKIQIMDYKGRAVVFVSCVTKDEPYRPHPHNLVGREGCKQGVCTLKVPTETMCVTFTNMGIQCVKRKDIENALRMREQIKVDPFLTGYSHRDQPALIDLNAVRLCFQVFLEDENGKYTRALDPVVSQPIFDKKAVSDLVINKLSHCVCYADGGRNEIVLLCEKVSKEDIQVRFFDATHSPEWEALGDFHPAQVHKQTAICFRPPPYKNPHIKDPVKVSIQLRRPSDDCTSNALPFEYIPIDSGRPLYWSFRRSFSSKHHSELLNTLLTNNEKPRNGLPESVPILEAQEIIVETNNNEIAVTKPTKIEPEKSFNQLINQVAELDEIYSDTQARLLNTPADETSNFDTRDSTQRKESFDDSKTYTSLQMAFKNPVASPPPSIKPIDEEKPPLLERNKRESDLEKPPLPPKRVKKIETYIGNSMQSLQSEPLLKSNRSHSFSLARPGDRLPPTPCSTLPNPKKRGIFSKLFGRKSKTPSVSRETSAPPSLNRLDTNLGRSAGNISTASGASVRIPLKDDQPSKSLNDLNKNRHDPNFGQDLALNLDLTEAEHYALYMAMAPHATQSEFDEMSCYYAPVEGGKILTGDSMPKLPSKT